MSQLKITITAIVATIATSAPPLSRRPGRDHLKKMLACPSNNRAVLHSERNQG